MDPRDPSQRPSIFKTPEPMEERHPPEQEPPRPTEPEPQRDFWAEPPVGARQPRREPTPPSGSSRRLLIGLGAGGLLLLAVGGFVAASVLGPDEDPVGVASPSASVSAPASIAPTATAEPTATPSPTPEPTPAGPPQEVPVGAWATVTAAELNVRSAAGTDATSNYLLVRGSVVHVAEGPTVVADLNWYRIASLGGAVGWVTSGWVAEPFLTTLVDDPTLIRCGEIGSDVYDIVDGAPIPHDPIAIGDLALPASAFSDLSLGAMELLRGVGEEACFSAQVGSDGVPMVSSQLLVNACGHAVADGDYFRLRPAAGEGIYAQSQVKDPAIVHPALLVGGPPDDRKSSNIRSVFRLIASNPDAVGCMSVNVVDDEGGAEVYQSVDTALCSIVHEYTLGNIKLSSAAGGDTIWIKLNQEGWQYELFPLEVPVYVHVSASANDERRDAYAYLGEHPDCS